MHDATNLTLPALVAVPLILPSAGDFAGKWRRHCITCLDCLGYQCNFDIFTSRRCRQNIKGKLRRRVTVTRNTDDTRYRNRCLSIPSRNWTPISGSSVMQIWYTGFFWCTRFWRRLEVRTLFYSKPETAMHMTEMVIYDWSTVTVHVFHFSFTRKLLVVVIYLLFSLFIAYVTFSRVYFRRDIGCVTTFFGHI